MKYFIDTEFVEGTQRTLFGKTKPTIDLISIGIVAEDGREYYAISKDFNLKEAWNRFQIEEETFGDGFGHTHITEQTKVYWLRDNVLKSIFREWYAVHNNIDPTVFDHKFTYKEFKRLLNKYGKTNKQIAQEILAFVDKGTTDVSFYGYYADYDWVVFCWLFGNMIDLPKGFPMYCIDLKQTLNTMCDNDLFSANKHGNTSFSLTGIKKHPKYPKQVNEHNALADARWNKELFYFLQ